MDKINVPLRVELPGVGENVQEHLLIAVSYGEHCRSDNLNDVLTSCSLLELRDDVDFETIDVLRDHPELVEKHAQLQ